MSMGVITKQWRRRPKRGARRQNPARLASTRILTPSVQSPASPPKVGSISESSLCSAPTAAGVRCWRRPLSKMSPCSHGRRSVLYLYLSVPGKTDPSRRACSQHGALCTKGRASCEIRMSYMSYGGTGRTSRPWSLRPPSGKPSRTSGWAGANRGHRSALHENPRAVRAA